MLPAENLDNKIKEFWPKNGPSIEEVEKYVKKYSKEKIVIKCGGRVLLDPALLNGLIEDVAILKKLGLTPLLVHGGGLGIKKKSEELNIKNKFIMGLRVTDNKMIKIVFAKSAAFVGVPIWSATTFNLSLVSAKRSMVLTKLSPNFE